MFDKNVKDIMNTFQEVPISQKLFLKLKNGCCFNSNKILDKFLWKIEWWMIFLISNMNLEYEKISL